MSGSICLDGVWQAVFTEDAPEYMAGPNLEGQCPLPVSVPGTIHASLERLGLIDDPRIGLNSLRARWVEEQFWSLRRTFDLPEEAVGQPAWLCFETLEAVATVFVNGAQVGSHVSAHRSARFEVTQALRPGENQVVVLVETGLHALNDKPVAGYGADWPARMTRRPLIRKAQHQCGWDWHPRLMNVGITGSVRLEYAAAPKVERCWVTAAASADLDSAEVTARVSLLWTGSEPAEGFLRLEIDGARAESAVTVQPGGSVAQVALRLDQPRLWWPRGHGEQALYDARVTWTSGGEEEARVRRFGVRKVEIDQSAHPVTGSYCILRVNDRPIFCKGGNWVPADLYHDTVSGETYRELVARAVGANFNTLRVWGGGIYAPEVVCEACDEAGILIWHDLGFACAQYPGDDPDFLREVEAEVTEAMRARMHHPSLVVWCGSNEIEWGDHGWGYAGMRPAHPHYAMFHLYLPRLAAREDPTRVYWISSPYSPDYRDPNDPVVGDQHPWGVSIMKPGPADFWQYRDYVDRFPNEGGVLGATGLATLRDFLPEADRRVLSPSWAHHDNPLAIRASQPGELGRAYQTLRLWTGLNHDAIPMPDYALLSGMLQAEGLSEYIRNYRRRMFSSASAVFWMYNDSWPVTHGWTIVDYYLRPKLAYHPVRRAFAPVIVVLAHEGDEVQVHLVNETRETWIGDVRFGVFGLAGGLPLDETVRATVAPNSASRVAALPVSAMEAQGLTRSGAFAMADVGDGTAAVDRLFLARFGDLEFAGSEIKADLVGDRLVVTSDTFAWGVCLHPECEAWATDDVFDVIAGIGYTLPWRQAAPAAGTIQSASRTLERNRVDRP
ncbi:MAG: hypothetical protein NT029_18425 [Armatimonadetes bacterium]|nr:hypothetical protein [Armatimonadota bacterium]